jgi:hypothetical protein
MIESGSTTVWSGEPLLLLLLLLELLVAEAANDDSGSSDDSGGKMPCFCSSSPAALVTELRLFTVTSC